jgi:hypothetical protein
MTRRLLPALWLLTTVALFAEAAHASISLRYRGRVGQVATYRLLMKATGEQISLGERRPVSIEAEFELRQQVVATGPLDSFSSELTARPIRIKDPTGTFASNGRSRSLAVQLTITPRGEVLSTAPLSDNHVGPYERAFAAFLSLPGVLLPAGSVSVGGAWESHAPQGGQRSRLTAIRRTPFGLVARIDATATAPVRLQEESQGLGLSTTVSGFETRRESLELLVDDGIVLSNKGESSLLAHGEITLDLPEGRRRFPISSQMRVVFELRLTRLDGKPIGGG